ncbi:hypothetical protein BKA61DRAFT_673814 [Leptodontidium sp. MPI-SDFR-AT-0119]|nr:hypothetical protein BKA61DRAFT_673814 [Leptodontidium sp. MPI-SDFR-AT-0119]
MVLRCGTSSIAWDSFCLGIKVLQEELWLVKDELLQRDVARASGASQHTAWSTTSLHLVYRDLSILSQRDEAGEVGLPFWRLIDIANSAECKDHRDKVYGLIGLMDSNIGKELEPNYKIPPREVYTEVSKAFMKTYQTLDPIREGDPWGPTKTPSWVADWMWDGGRLSQARIENRLWGPAWLSGKSIPDSSVYRPYEASLGGTMDISFLDTGLLACTGFITDTIAGLSARGRGFFAWSMASIVQAKEWKSIYGNRDETSKALYRCLVADRVGGGQIPSDRHAVILNLPSTFNKAKLQFEKRGWSWLASQDNYYFRWEEWRKANRNFQMGDWLLNDFFSDIIPADALEHDFTEVYACFDRTCQKRRFIITEKGYMGWAPDNIHGSVRDQTMGGDLIAILLGCSTPVVIRPNGDYFKVIGEAYVQGIMEGEAMDFLKEGKVERRNFTFY